VIQPNIGIIIVASSGHLDNGFDDTDVQFVNKWEAVNDNFPESDGSDPIAIILLYVQEN
jgi:hypothetical protein